LSDKYFGFEVLRQAGPGKRCRNAIRDLSSHGIELLSAESPLIHINIATAHFAKILRQIFCAATSLVEPPFLFMSDDPPPHEVPAPGTPTYFVGIGASAGGLEALESFFAAAPLDSGCAFIVVQHLSPDYKSLMVELLSKRTAMPVRRAEEGMQVEANVVYLIPPRKVLRIFHGKLLLTDIDPGKGLNLPIDIFLRSLAEDQGEKAIGVILSGTGSDGVRGLRAIKEAGGMVMAQSPESAKFDGMPRAAIDTGLVDVVLPPDEMPAG
jgi:chemotaxis response regulator CheB